MTPPVRALTNVEERVLAAVGATGQDGGWLYDTNLIAQHAGVSRAMAALALRRLEVKGYVPPVPDEAVAQARQQLGGLADLIRARQAEGTIPWRRSGVNPEGAQRFLDGRPVRPPTVEGIVRALGVQEPARTEYVRAAGLVSRHAAACRARNGAPPAAVKAIPCALCGKLVLQNARRDVQHPLCTDCYPHRSLLRRKRNDGDLTEGGRWLNGVILDLWGSREQFRQETHIEWSTQEKLLYRTDYSPPISVLERLTEAIARKQRDRGEEAVTYDTVLALWGGKTLEDTRREAHPRPQCPICGRPRASDNATCSRLCAELRALLRLWLRTRGGKRLWAVCAASADVPSSRIADVLAVPLETVEAWLGLPACPELLVRVRQERGQSTALLLPVARVFGMSVNALRLYLTGRYRLQGRKNRVPLQHARYVHIMAPLLGMTEGEFAEEFEVDSFKTYARDRIRRLQPTRWQPKSRGRPVSHQLTRRIHDLRAQGKSDKEISNILEESGETILTPKEVYWRPIQHARACEKCRPMVACDLAARGRITRQIAILLGTSAAGVVRAIQREQKRMPVFAYGGLTVPQAAQRLHRNPRKVRELADSGRIPVTRTPGGWRKFDPQSLRSTP